MSGKAKRSGRPPSKDKKDHAVQIRLDALGSAELDAVVAWRRRTTGSEEKGPAVIRWLISQKARAIGAPGEA